MTSPTTPLRLAAWPAASLLVALSLLLGGCDDAEQAPAEGSETGSDLAADAEHAPGAEEGQADHDGNGDGDSDGDSPPPIAPEPLTQRHEFTDDVAVEVREHLDGREETVVALDDASHLAVVEFTIQPGAWFPWHTHPGPVLVSLTENELVFIYGDDCVERSYPAGTAFVDPGGDNVHTAYNPSDTEETKLVATFLDAPADGELVTPIDDERAAALDDACDVEAGAGPDHEQ